MELEKNTSTPAPPRWGGWGGKRNWVDPRRCNSGVPDVSICIFALMGRSRQHRQTEEKGKSQDCQNGRLVPQGKSKIAPRAEPESPEHQGKEGACIVSKRSHVVA